MTNWEKNKETFLKISACGIDFAVEKRTGKIVTCNDLLCADCLFKDEYLCSGTTRMKWLDEEYVEPKKPEIDWSKVPVDTPILAYDNYDEPNYKVRCHFAYYKDGYFYAWVNRGTSWVHNNNKNAVIQYKHAEIAPGIDCSKWYLQ